MYGCGPYRMVTRKIEIPTISTTTRTTRWARDRLDAHGNYMDGVWLTEPEVEIVLPLRLQS